MESKSTSFTKQSAFKATRLTPTTFLIKEYDDMYSEHPHIYAKVVQSANTILIIDTGCGGASNDPDVQVKSLRVFIETVRVGDNNDEPLNGGGKMKYLIVTTHCHYDHILGVEQFKDSPILASSHSPAFLSASALPENSLCNAKGIPTPSYAPVLIPHLGLIRSVVEGHPLGITLLHTPGHTPDELALYDTDEKMLYVGDSLYEYEDIIFPNEGSIVQWFTSIDYLINFVNDENQNNRSVTRNVLINSGHCTVTQPALETLERARAFMEQVVNGTEEVKERFVVRGEENVVYRQKAGKFSLRCPERLVEDARQMDLT